MCEVSLRARGQPREKDSGCAEFPGAAYPVMLEFSNDHRTLSMEKTPAGLEARVAISHSSQVTSFSLPQVI